MKKFMAMFLMLFFAFVLVGCGNTEQTNGSTGKILIQSNGKTLTVSSIAVNAQVQLKAVDAKTLKEVSVTWTSDKPEAATVDQNGLVTGVATGKGIVVIGAEDKDGNTAVVRFSVNTAGAVGSYPDLGGYTIKIANASHALHETDPTFVYVDDQGNPIPGSLTYAGDDKDARVAAWNWVEQTFNCSLEAVAYPSNADWGPARWNYILDQGRKNISDFDFLTVPDSQIPTFVAGNCLIDVSDFYQKYGTYDDNTEILDPVYKKSGTYQGKLYSVTNGDADIYNVMYYNVNLWKSLNAIDPSLKEPAQAFLDDEWSYDDFLTYCTKAQAAMNSLPDAQQKEYHAVAGHVVYYWVGLVNASGTNICDPYAMKVYLEAEAESKAADLMKNLYDAQLVDGSLSAVDGSVESWNNQTALFNTGDLWFVRDAGRWTNNQWGEGTTQYGYVPFPSLTGKKEDYHVGLGGTATWVMPVGRQNEYAKYGNEVNPENIYLAVMMYYKKTREFYKGPDSGYDEEAARLRTVQKFTDSPASVDAMVYVKSRLKDISFFEPLSTSDNPVVSTYSGTFVENIRGYMTGKKSSWADAIAGEADRIQNLLAAAYS